LADFVEFERAKTLGEAIRWARWSEFKRQRQVAGDEYSPQAISLVELDKVVPTLETLDHITRRLNRPEGHFYPLYISVASEPRCLVEVAKRLITAQNYGDAERALDRAREFLDSGKDSVIYAALLVQQSRLLRMRGTLEDGLEFTERALAETAESKYPLRACRLYAELAYIYMKMHDRYEEGYRANSRALTLYHLTGHDEKYLLRRILQNMGWLLWRLNVFDAALHSFGEALQLAEELDRSHDIADIKHGMAMCWWGKGCLETALQLMEEAIPQLDGMYLQAAHTNAGIILYDLGRKREALSHLDEALELWQPSYSPYTERYMALNEKGRVLLDLGHLEEGISLLNEAWALLQSSGDAEEKARNLLYRAEAAHRRADHRTSLALLQQAAALNLAHPRLTPLIHIRTAQSCMRIDGGVDEAHQALNSAAQFLDRREETLS